MVRHEHPIHVSDACLEAGGGSSDETDDDIMSSSRVREGARKCLPVLEERGPDEVIVFPLKALHMSLKGTDEIP